MANADVKGMTETAEKYVTAVAKEIEATVTGHQLVTIDGGEGEFTTMPKEWAGYKVGLTKGTDHALESAVVSYTRLITHAYKLKLMGVETGKGIPVKEMNTGQLLTTYKRAVRHKYEESEPYKKSLKEIKDGLSTYEGLRKKAAAKKNEALKQQTKLDKDTKLSDTKRKERQAKIDKLTKKSEDLADQATQGISGNQKLQKDLADKSEIVVDKALEGLGEQGSREFGRALLEKVAENMSEDLDSGLVATVVPVRFTFRTRELDAGDLDKRIKFIRNKRYQEYLKERRGLVDDAQKAIRKANPGRNMSDVPAYNQITQAEIGMQTARDNELRDASPLPRISLGSKLGQKFDDETERFYGREQEIWASAVEDLTSANEDYDDAKAELGKAIITDFKVQTKEEFGGKEAGVKYLNVDTKVTINVRPTNLGEAETNKIEVAFVQEDTSFLGTKFKLPDKQRGSLTFTPDGQITPKGDIGLFMSNHLASA